MKMFNLKAAQADCSGHTGEETKHVLSVWLGDVGFQREVPFLFPYILPGMLPSWSCPFVSAYSTPMERDMQQKREGQGPFCGQYIPPSQISSYTPLSPLNVKALCWPPSQLLRPTELLIQTWTQGKKKGVWKVHLHTLLTYAYWIVKIPAPV